MIAKYSQYKIVDHPARGAEILCAHGRIFAAGGDKLAASLFVGQRDADYRERALRLSTVARVVNDPGACRECVVMFDERQFKQVAAILEPLPAE